MNKTRRGGALLGQMGSSKAGAGSRGPRASSSLLPLVVNELPGTSPCSLCSAVGDLVVETGPYGLQSIFCLDLNRTRFLAAVLGKD